MGEGTNLPPTIQMSVNFCHFVELYLHLRKGAVSQNSAKLGNYKMPIKLRET